MGNVILRALNGKRKSDYFTKYNSLLNKKDQQKHVLRKNKKLIFLLQIKKKLRHAE